MANRHERSNQDKLIIQRVSIGACIVLVIVAIALIATSLKKVEETEYGLMYTRWR